MLVLHFKLEFSKQIAFLFQNESLRSENAKLRETNESLKNETKSFHFKAEDLSKRLASLTDELQTKEKAIRRYTYT